MLTTLPDPGMLEEDLSSSVSSSIGIYKLFKVGDYEA
jgi:hypothetical protein